MRLPIAFVVVWSTGYIAGPIALRHADPLGMLAMRFALATTAFALLALILRAPWPKTRAEWLHISIAGLLVQGVQFGCVYGGMSLGVSAGLTALIVGSMPLVVALIGGWTLGERVVAKQWLGLALGLGGVVVVVLSRSQHLGASSLLGIGLVAAGTLALATGTVYQKRFIDRIDLFTAGTLQSGISAVALLVLALATHARIAPDPEFDLAMLWLVGVNSLGAASMMLLMLKADEANRVASWFFLIPPVSAAMSALVLGERFTALTLVGFALAATGVALTSRTRAVPAAHRAPSREGGPEPVAHQ